jgi:hypothetical protein
LSRVDRIVHEVEYPKAKIPTVEVPAAEPFEDAALEEVAEALTSPEYVYLFRVDVTLGSLPKAKMPIVEFPAADPLQLPFVEDVALAFVSLEYVYLFLVVDSISPAIPPNAKMPIVEFPTADPPSEAALAAAPEATTHPE